MHQTASFSCDPRCKIGRIMFKHLQFGTGKKRVITKGVFSLEESLESGKSQGRANHEVQTVN